MMNFLEKLKDRYNVLILVLVVLMSLLSLQLAILTIAKGDYYRNQADNLRLREVRTVAPRGEIRDRNGKLLAGNIPNFTVQLYKDEIERYDRTNIKEDKNLKKNEAFLILARLLEEDGVNYEDEYPFKTNTFAYRQESDYLQEDKEPIDKLIEIIVDNQLLPEMLNLYYKNKEYPEHYDYILVSRAISSYKKKGMIIPIDIEITETGLSYKFTDEELEGEWKEKNEIPSYYSPQQSIIHLIDYDSTVIKTMIDHPIGRKLTYQLIADKGLAGNISLEDQSISYKTEYQNQKRKLSQIYDAVTMDTSALEDFTNIFKQEYLEEFLTESYETEERRKKQLIPGEMLIEMIEEKIPDLPIAIEKDKNNFFYINKEDENMSQEEIIELLISYAETSNSLGEFLNHANIKGHAQSRLLQTGVNPKISITSDVMEYVSLAELEQYYNEHRIKLDDYDQYENLIDIPADLVLEKLIEYYNIDENLSDYEIRSVLNIYDRIKRQGHLAYEPINIAYGIKNETVAKIEEDLMEVPGVNVTVESVRYYPQGRRAAHILGYLGKISQEDEIEEYVVKKKYLESDIIGKTGIEESFEEDLRGKTGAKKIEVDPVGNTIKEIESENDRAEPGNDIYLSLDLDLQEVAEESLRQSLEQIQVGGVFQSEWGNFRYPRSYPYASSGGVVVVDVKTGQVLASASYPAYDPNLFSTGISSTDWNSLFPENKDDMLAPRPLYNIVTQTAVQPGSVYKMATALSALEKGLSPNKQIRDMGVVDIGNSSFECLVWTLGRQTHGYTDVRRALGESCNYYFYTLALGENQKTGEQLGMNIDIYDMIDTSEKLGLGQRTGIEINNPLEVKGSVPNPERKLETSKALMRQDLRRILHEAYPENHNIDEDRRDQIIEKILSWADEDRMPLKGEVVNRLYELGLEGEKRLASSSTGEDLADRITFTHLNQAGWNIADTLNTTIGQGQSAYTPIQMANYVATIANGGYRHDLSLLDKIEAYDGSNIVYEHEASREKIQLNDYRNLEALKEGMRAAARTGTASGTFANFPVDVGVKTGTAENNAINPYTNQKYDDFSWFVGFAPYDNPEIAVATVLFQGGSGSYAGPLVREVMAEYLGLNDNTNLEN